MGVNVLMAGGVGVVVGFVVGYLAGRGRGGSSKRVAAGSEPTGDGIELYVGNLSYDMTDPDLEKAFAVFGKVLSARIIKNKFNERSKGYGFVEMDGQSGADKAVKAMNGKEVLGRKLVVNEARSKSRE
ncbi:MAG: RNA recognition motif domain-containing protein [Kiritimatiellia bacterium]